MTLVNYLTIIPIRISQLLFIITITEENNRFILPLSLVA
jgi:hypothetical protein